MASARIHRHIPGSFRTVLEKPSVIRSGSGAYSGRTHRLPGVPRATREQKCHEVAGTDGAVRHQSGVLFLEPASVTADSSSILVELAKRALMFLSPESIVTGAWD